MGRFCIYEEHPLVQLNLLVHGYEYQLLLHAQGNQR